jgi:hypothetical protein
VKPTLGRIVHFYAGGNSAPRAAIVTAVHGDDVVSLSVFDPMATFVEPHARVAGTSTPIKVTDPYWSWPPRE